MKTINIKDSYCGIVIECPSEYDIVLRSDDYEEESSLIFSKHSIIRDAMTGLLRISCYPVIKIKFNTSGKYIGGIDDPDETYEYMMNKSKTNIISYYRYKNNSVSCGVEYEYQDNEYLTDQIGPINEFLSDLDIIIKPWFIRSDIVCQKMGWPIVAKHYSNLIYGLKSDLVSPDSELMSKVNKTTIFSEIKDIIINDPATIILWKDEIKTIVKCQPGDIFDPEKGIAMAILKKIYGNGGFYKDIFEPAINKYELRKSLEKSKKHVVSKKEKKPIIK